MIESIVARYGPMICHLMDFQSGWPILAKDEVLFLDVPKHIEKLGKYSIVVGMTNETFHHFLIGTYSILGNEGMKSQNFRQQR